MQRNESQNLIKQEEKKEKFLKNENECYLCGGRITTYIDGRKG